jgi:hypothetical protein
MCSPAPDHDRSRQDLAPPARITRSLARLPARGPRVGKPLIRLTPQTISGQWLQEISRCTFHAHAERGKTFPATSDDRTAHASKANFDRSISFTLTRRRSI